MHKCTGRFCFDYIFAKICVSCEFFILSFLASKKVKQSLLQAYVAQRVLVG